MQKSFFRTRIVSLDAVLEPAEEVPDDHREVLEAAQALPWKYRQVVYLHYYEEYSAPEIARILNKNVNTIYSLLARARKRLARALGEAAYE